MPGEQLPTDPGPVEPGLLPGAAGGNYNYAYNPQYMQPQPWGGGPQVQTPTAYYGPAAANQNNTWTTSPGDRRFLPNSGGPEVQLNPVFYGPAGAPPGDEQSLIGRIFSHTPIGATIHGIMGMVRAGQAHRAAGAGSAPGGPAAFPSSYGSGVPIAGENWLGGGIQGIDPNTNRPVYNPQGYGQFQPPSGGHIGSNGQFISGAAFTPSAVPWYAAGQRVIGGGVSGPEATNSAGTGDEGPSRFFNGNWRWNSDIGGIERIGPDGSPIGTG